MRNRRIVVMGASGFIGRYVVKKLAASGAIVVAVSRDATSAGGFLRPMGDVGQVSLVDCSLNDAARLGSLLDGAYAVVNCAGILCERGPQRFTDLHETGPARLAALAQASGVKRFIHISALSADPDSSSAYARSKGRGETAVSKAFPGATILRPSLVFGPEDNFFNRFAAMTRLSPALPLIGGGQTRFAPVYVGNVAQAVETVLERADSAGVTYELAGPRVYTLKELFEKLLAEIGRHRALIPVPFWMASILGGVGEAVACVLSFPLGDLIPDPLITRDQVRLLRTDSVPTDAPGLAALGIEAEALELELPLYLDRYRRGGRAPAVHQA